MGQEYYDEAGVPIRSRFTYGFVEPSHTEKVLLVDASGRPLIVVEANDITKWGGTALTGRDISTDLSNLDVALSTKMKPADLNLDIDKDLQVDVKSSALPTGAATEATLGTRALESGGNLANIKNNTDTLDINLSRAALAANVVQNCAQANWGYYYGFVDAGTPIPASTTNTLLDISGFGKLTFVTADIDHTVTTHINISLDGEDMLGLLSAPAYLGYRKGSDSKLGLQTGWIDVIHWESLKYGIDFHVGKLGSFGSSAQVRTQNGDTGNAHKAHLRANYLVSASKQFTITNPAKSDPAKVRVDLANTLGIDPEGITAIYQINWDDEKQLNVPSLSTIIHPKLTKAGETEASSFLNQRKAGRGNK